MAVLPVLSLQGVLVDQGQVDFVQGLQEDREVELLEVQT